MLRYIVPISSLLLVTPVAAEPAPLSGDAIKEMVAGAVIEVDTPAGVGVPVRFSDDGRLAGDARSLAYILGSPSDVGRWWVASDRLCQKWTRWFDGAIHCLRISQHGSRIYWRRDDGETGTASIVSPSRRVVARLENSDEPPKGREAPQPERPTSLSIASALAVPRAEAAIAPPMRDVDQAAPVEKPSPVEKKAGPARQPTRAKELLDKQARVPAPAPEKRPAGPAKRAPPLEAHRPGPAPAAESFRVAGVALYDVLNVRDGPSAEHRIVGTLLPDAEGVRVVGQCMSDWCPISFRGVAGWVNSSYLAKSGSPAARRRALSSTVPEYREYRR